MADKEITLVLNLKVDGQGNITAAAEGIKKVGAAADQTAKKTQKSVNALKGFATAGMAIMMAKQALGFLVDGMKKTEEGAAALKEITKATDDIKIAFAAGAMPAMKTFSDFLVQNKGVIEGIAKGIGKAFTVMGDLIALVMSGIMAAVTAPLWLWGKEIALLGSLMKKVGISMGADFEAFGKNMTQTAETNFKAVGESAKIMVEDIVKEPPKLTKVMSEEEKKRLKDAEDAAKKAADIAKKLAEEKKKANADWWAEQADINMGGWQKEQEMSQKQTELISQIETKMRDNATGRMKEGLEKDLKIKQDQYDKDIADLQNNDAFLEMEVSQRNAILQKLEIDHQLEMQNIRSKFEDDFIAKQKEKAAKTLEVITKANEEQAKKDAEAAALNKAGWTKAQEEQIAGVQQTLSVVSGIASQFQALISNITAMQLQNVDEWTAAQKKKAKETIKDETALQKEMDKIDKQALEKQKEIKEQEKAMAIVMAIINGATAIVRGFADFGPVGGAIFAVLTAAVTATQVALIASQKFAQGGIVQGTSTSGDTTLVRANAGELILNRAQQENVAGQLSSNVSVGGDTIIINGNADASTVDAIRQTRTDQLSAIREMLLELQYRGQMV